MLRPQRKRSQDKKVKGTLRKVNSLHRHAFPFHFYTEQYISSCRSARWAKFIFSKSAISQMHSSSAAGRETFVSHNPGRVAGHPSITGWKTAPRASGADDAALVLFPDSGGIMLSGVAELSVFSIQNGNTSKKERCHEVAGLIVLRSVG